MQCKKRLSDVGIEPDAMVLGSLDVHPVQKRLYIKTDDGRYRRYGDDLYERFDEITGYEYESFSRLEFDVRGDIQQAEQVWTVLAQCDGVEYDIQFFLADDEGPKNELVKAAVSEARSQAELFADAAGCALGRVLLIEADGEARAISAARCAREVPEDATYVPIIKPTPVSIERSVEIVWELLDAKGV